MVLRALPQHPIMEMKGWVNLMIHIFTARAFMVQTGMDMVDKTGIIMVDRIGMITDLSTGLETGMTAIILI